MVESAVLVIVLIGGFSIFFFRRRKNNKRLLPFAPKQEIDEADFPKVISFKGQVSNKILFLRKIKISGGRIIYILN